MHYTTVYLVLHIVTWQISTIVTAYFGEEPTIASQEFYTTLTTFVQEFVVARDNLDRVRRLEAKKATREKEMRERQQSQSQLSHGAGGQGQSHIQHCRILLLQIDSI